jgi:beta-glucosidase/6-phospho-beta-glucosidase/beta-galactosidase
MSTIDKIMELRSQLQSELAKLQEDTIRITSKIEGIDAALDLLNQQDDKPEDIKRTKNLKAVIIDILIDKAELGASVIDVLEIARQQGFDLKRDSSSSVLSRLKNDGVVDYADGKYYLSEYHNKNIIDLNYQKPSIIENVFK